MSQIKISTANSRKAKHWKNETLDWRKFIDRCADTKRTKETVAEYFAMAKDKQSDIKDVGGFVGGHLINETAGRTKANIALRSCLTIDIDNAPAGLWENFTSVYEGAAVCYSTHKHTPEKPRLRIVVPFDRDTTPDEYPAVSRRFCKDRGLMGYIDPTTHDPNRLFYWPSTSTDGEFYHQQQDGSPLNVDAVLAKYEDWRDCSLWPTSETEGAKVVAAIAKAQDPTLKSGVIGAFCRTYTVSGAISKFLSDVYDPCTTSNDRYTFKGGSTSGGAILYEDKYLYSHHASDPAGGQLCNAFDLVRIHLFGQLDAEAKPDTPANRLPSYNKMCELSTKDPETKRAIMVEKTRATAEDFDGINYDANTGTDWQDKLSLDNKGNVLNTLNNLRIIILNDEVLRGVRYDQFARGDVTEPHSLKNADGSRGVNDEVLGKIALHIEARYNIRITPKKVNELLSATAAERGFNPVREFITSTEWDGRKRVDTLLIDYLGATDNAANREVTRKWIVAAVARVFNPGCAFQNVLTLTGPQGIGKSSFLRILAVNRDRFCDTLCVAEPDAKRNEATRGAWIVEIGELNGLSRAEWQSLKSYISRDTDSGRAAYAVKRTDSPRQYVFAATTNDAAFLREADKGNRRWWVVPVNGIREAVKDWIMRLTDEVPQIWAEAYRLYLNGEDILSLSEHTAKYMTDMQWMYSEDADDPMPGMVGAFLDTLLPVDWEMWNEAERRAYFRSRDPLDAEGTFRRDRVCAVVYLYEREGLQRKDKGYKSAAMKFNSYMRGNPEWEERDRLDFGIYGRQRGYIRKPDKEEDDI